MAVKFILSRLLQQRGISKRQFAKMIRMSYPNLFPYFKAKANPRLRTLERFAKALGCKVKDLIEE